MTKKRKITPEEMLNADKQLKADAGGTSTEEGNIGPFKLQTVKDALMANEDGDSFLMIELYRDKYRFDYYEDPKFAWFYWNDHFWRQDVRGNVLRDVHGIIEIYDIFRRKQEWIRQKIEVGAEPDLSESEKEQKAKSAKFWAKKATDRIEQLQTLRRKNNILTLATVGLDSLGFVGDQWDTDPWLLGCRNGVVNLKTGEFRDGRPDDNIKMASPIEYDPEATCPEWEKFLFEVFQQDQEVVNFIQRLFGYAITGLRTEHIFPIFWGENGRNGKGTIFETFKAIMGDMAYKVNSDVLMQQFAHSGGDGPSASMMKFKGTRIAWASETNKKDSLDAAKIKAMSGGDTITARNPHGRKLIDFVPTHTLFILVNPRPRVDAEDDALWQRLILIGMPLTFIDDPDPKKPLQRKKDPHLMDKLAKELPGITRWGVEGTGFWKKQGLNPPESLKAATQKYRKEEDLFGNFLAARCEVDLTNNDYRTTPKDLYVAYKEWCHEDGFKPMNMKHFNESAKFKFGETVKSNGVRTYRGVVVFSNTL